MSESTFEYDVFISYSSKDKAWVRGELLTRIERAGLTAFIDYRDFTRGAPSIKECERGVVQSRKTLLILTPNYVEHSEWGDMENIMAQTLDPGARQLRVIPLLKADCKKPVRIGALTHIDFTDGADRDLAWRQLLTALGKPPEPAPPKEPKRDDWFLAHPYPMPPNFTGRIAERSMLTVWLNGDLAHPLLVQRALGGFGKSALAWHWLLHDVPPANWPRVVWWSFYEGDASFDHFLRDALEYLTDQNAAQLDPRQQLAKLLHLLHQPGTLLILDGFERVLRAFGGLDAAYQGDDTDRPNDRDCLSPLAEHFLRDISVLEGIRARVLLTTRLRPRSIEGHGGVLLPGCREEELTQLQPADAVEFFRAQGIRGTHTEIEAACEPYGYHPLSLRLLAGLVVGDFQQPGDIAAARRLDVSGDLVQRQHHVLEQSYDALPPKCRGVLGRIACFRSPVGYQVLKALADEDKIAPSMLDMHLRDLIARGLLHHDRKENRFDLHPIVRRYAYDRLAAPDRATAHTLLRDYFAAVPKADKVTRLEDLAPVIELYHHTVRAGQLDEALMLYRERLSNPLHYQLGAYQLIIDLLRALFLDGEDRPPRLKDEAAQAWTLNVLASAYSLSGQPRPAVPLFEQQNAMFEERGDKRSLAIGLGNGAYGALLPIGALRAAETDLRRSIALCEEIEDEQAEAVHHPYLAPVLAYRGASTESEAELTTALEMFEKQHHTAGQSTTWAYRGLLELLLLRSVPQSAIRDPQTAVQMARRALELADEWARAEYPIARDYVRAHWLLGAAHRVAGEDEEAERHLHQALERCRRINLVEIEADILIDLARLRAAAHSTQSTDSASSPQADEARRLAEEALIITERSGYVLQGADAHLELAKLAVARGDRAAAKNHAQKAKDLATCDGPPDYTYKAAYDEAVALLKQLG